MAQGLLGHGEGLELVLFSSTHSPTLPVSPEQMGGDMGNGTRMSGLAQGTWHVDEPALTSSHRGRVPQYPSEDLTALKLRIIIP